MKHLKKFEGFNPSSIYKRFFNRKKDDSKMVPTFGKVGEVSNDVKSIIYILEDDGYDVKCTTKDECIGKPHDCDIRLLIRLPEETNTNVLNKVVKLHTDSKHFLSLLKEHLDYISDIKMDIMTTLVIIKINL